MRIGSWNIRGLNKGLKQKGVENLFWSKDLGVLGVLETKLSSNALQKLKSCRFQHLHLEQHCNQEEKGRILQSGMIIKSI